MATTKQRLSDMLDADLSQADVQEDEEMTASKPSTFSDWLQARSSQARSYRRKNVYRLRIAYDPYDLVSIVS